MRPQPSRPLLRGALLVAALSLTGCSSGEDDAARDTARQFHRALAARDGQAACALLAPVTREELERSSGRPCATALLAEHVPREGDPETVEVFGTMAQLRYPGETVFLGRFEQGWRVMAAACAARPSQPYECRVKGA